MVFDTRGDRKGNNSDTEIERNALEASYVSLQRKSELYEKMRDRVHDEDGTSIPFFFIIKKILINLKSWLTF